ncbi:DUF2232 domain-containing protein [Desulfosarcina cetonica]|uniref:DUF2232 domain-containing protein n=1 Tax=Desulfosarcina cetonica TaxID=90730 RepID=UPI0006CF9DA2|nr:DUF2232 domain-containing protein [Desulfosarcina cetonica]
MAGSPFQRGVSKDIATGVMATLVIFSASVFMPVIGFVFSIFIPLPVLFYRTKLGRRHGMIVPLLTIAIIGLVVGSATLDIIFFSGLMLLGFSLSELFEKPLSVEMTIVAACGVVLGTGLGAMLIYSVVKGTGIISLVSTYVGTNLELSLKLYQEVGIPQETIDTIAGSLDRIQYVLVRLLPSMVAASTLFVAWTNLIAARPLLEHRGLAVPDFGRLNHWRRRHADLGRHRQRRDHSAAGVRPAAGRCQRALDHADHLFYPGDRHRLLLLREKGASTPLRVFIYTMIALQQIFLLVVICIGIFDMWINFRKIGPDKREPDLPA